MTMVKCFHLICIDIFRSQFTHVWQFRKLHTKPEITIKSVSTPTAKPSGSLAGVGVISVFVTSGSPTAVYTHN